MARILQDQKWAIQKYEDLAMSNINIHDVCGCDVKLTQFAMVSRIINLICNCDLLS